MADSSAPDEFAPPKGQFELARPPAGGIPAPTVIPIPTRVPGTNSEHPTTGKTITKPGSISP